MTSTRRRLALILTAAAVALLGGIAPASASTPPRSHEANEAHEIGYWKKASLTGLLPVSLGGYSVTNRAQASAVFKATKCGKRTSNALGCLAGADLVASLNIASGLGDTCMVANVAAANAFLIGHSYAGPGQRYRLSAPDRAQALALAAPLYDSDDVPCVITSYTLNVAKAGTGSGTVTSTPAGINCGATCSASFPPSTPVTLSAAASTGSHFSGWSGEGCSGTSTCLVTMDAARNVTATFDLNVAPVVTITSGPTGVIDQPTATFTFTDDGTPVSRQCWIDGDQPVRCSPSPSSFTTRSVSPGPHTFTVSVMNAYSQTSTDTRSWTYTPPNTAPVLDASKTPVLNPVGQDAGLPVGAVGTLVSTLVDFVVPVGQADNVSDPDGGAQLGIAVTAADTTNGSWYVNTGSGWVSMGAVSGSAALLLAADGSTRVYFKPAASYSGTVSSALTFRAWDRTTGTAGGTADTTTNGGSTAFSSATDTASITVIPN